MTSPASLSPAGRIVGPACVRPVPFTIAHVRLRNRIVGTAHARACQGRRAAPRRRRVWASAGRAAQRCSSSVVRQSPESTFRQGNLTEAWRPEAVPGGWRFALKRSGPRGQSPPASSSTWSARRREPRRGFTRLPRRRFAPPGAGHSSVRVLGHRSSAARSCRDELRMRSPRPGRGAAHFAAHAACAAVPAASLKPDRNQPHQLTDVTSGSTALQPLLLRKRR
jgi:hypothetical protein